MTSPSLVLARMFHFPLFILTYLIYHIIAFICFIIVSLYFNISLSP
jgi:hypothetical protein